MIVPRMLCRLYDPPHSIVEVSDPRAKYVLCTAGHPYTDEEADALGITAYLAAKDDQKAPEKAVEPPAEAKAVQQSAVEDKAVKSPEERKADEAEEPKTPDVIMTPETRRLRSR